MISFHVVHLTSVHQPSDTRIFQKECRTLANNGYAVTLVASHPRHEIVEGVELIPIARQSNRFRRMLLGTWSVYKNAFHEKADLYHFHDPELMLVGVLLKLTTRSRVVYDVHEHHVKKMFAREWMPRPLRYLASLGVRFSEWLFVPFYDAIICVAEHLTELYPEQKTYVIHNYPLLSISGDENKLTTDRSNDGRLVYTGGWTPHRGVYQLVEAMEHVEDHDAELRVIGRNLDGKVQRAASKLAGYNRVHYLGTIPYREVYEEMWQADIGLVCNQPRHDYDRAQPNKLFEYMSAGLPIIASNFPLWREIIEGHNCGITVDPTRPKDIARAIDYLLNNPKLRREMGDNGRQAVLERYNWSVEGTKLLNLYEEMLD